MTDEELISCLRSHILFNDAPISEAADRIEALIADVKDAKMRERYWSGAYDTVLAGRADEYDRAKAAEAKVARLVEALSAVLEIAERNECGSITDSARAALAEIKGEK